MREFIVPFVVFVLWVLPPAQGAGFKPLTRAEPIVRMVLQEAANESLAGMVAVVGVALDRIRDNRWPDNAHDVVYSPAQFTGMDIALRKYSERQIKTARIAVEIARSGTRPCGTVLWYHTTEVNPSWRKQMVMRCQLGAHLFYGDEQ